MKAVITVEVPDEFLAKRAAEYDEDAGGCGVETDPAEMFRTHVEELTEDEIPIAFFGWPVTVTFEVQP